MSLSYNRGKWVNRPSDPKALGHEGMETRLPFVFDGPIKMFPQTERFYKPADLAAWRDAVTKEAKSGWS